MTEVRVRLAPELLARARRGFFVRVALGAGRSAVMARVGGQLRAFENLCRHQTVALDFGSETPMADDGYHLACHQHGALYRPSDGLCVAGPCQGEKLLALEVSEGDDEGEFVLRL